MNTKGFTFAKAGVAAVALSFMMMMMGGCPTEANPPGPPPELTGTIKIQKDGADVTGDLTTGDILTAVYSVTTETGLSYQWKKDGEALTGKTDTTYTPATAGSYTVTVSKSGYNSKTSAAVTVTGSDLTEFLGTIEIQKGSPLATVTASYINQELTATYSVPSGETAETDFTYQWKKGDTNITTGGTSQTYTPTEAGTYTVIISKTGYASLSSAAVTVTVPDLAGTITIQQGDPLITVTTANINQELTATYSVPSGTTAETGLAYQWKKDSTNVSGANSATYTPTEVGTYTVTVSKTGYNSKTSAAVTVTDPSASTFAGNLTISPTSATTGTQLTANYTGSESGFTWQWKKGGTNVSGANSATYTPTEAGTYTVTISKSGFNDKTSSNSVTVTAAGLSTFAGNLTISPTSATTGTQLTATYSGSESGFTWQWKKDNANVATGQTYTPTAAGSYTVTISKEGYSPKESSAVTVEQGLSFQKGTIGNSLLPFSVRALTFLPNVDGGRFWAFDGASKNSYGLGTAFTANSVGTIFNNPKAAAVTPDGTIYAVSGDGKVKYLESTAARNANWTENSPTDIFGNNPINGIIYGGDSSKEKVIIVGDDGKLAYLNGTTWVQDTGINAADEDDEEGNYDVLDPSVDTNGIAYGGGKFVAVNASGEIAYSSGGDIASTTWTKVDSTPFSFIEEGYEDPTNININGIAYGGNKFVAVGGDGKIAYSSDGVAWTAAITPNQRNINGITYGNGMFVAVGDGKTVLYSTDGITWKQAVLPADGAAHNTSFSKVAYGEGSFQGSDFKRFVVTGTIASNSGLLYADVE